MIPLMPRSSITQVTSPDLETLHAASPCGRRKRMLKWMASLVKSMRVLSNPNTSVRKRGVRTEARRREKQTMMLIAALYKDIPWSFTYSDCNCGYYKRILDWMGKLRVRRNTKTSVR